MTPALDDAMTEIFVLCWLRPGRAVAGDTGRRCDRVYFRAVLRRVQRLWLVRGASGPSGDT